MFLERDNVYKIRLTYPYIGNRARINNLFELLERERISLYRMQHFLHISYYFTANIIVFCYYFLFSIVINKSGRGKHL